MSPPAPPRVDAGPIAFAVTLDPWGCRFVDGEDRPVLEEAPRRAGTPLGSFGFQDAASGRLVWRGGPLRQEPGLRDEDPPADGDWYHALAVADWEVTAQRLSAVLLTDDPAGRQMTLEVEAEAPGVLAVDVAVLGDTSAVVACGHGFAAHRDERFLGFGERSDAVVRSQGVVEHYVGEGPWQEHEYPFLAGVVPPWGLRQRRDATYYPVPWVLSTRGYGVLVDNDEVSYVRLRTASPEAWSVEVEADRLHYRVVAGPRPLDALARFTELTGRQGAPGSRWWFGPWYQSGHANHVDADEERGQLEALRRVRAPVSAVETHCRFLPLGAHRGWEASERARADWFHAQGLATLSYLNSMIGVDYAEVYGPAAATGGLQSRADGSPCLFQGYVGGQDPPRAVEGQFEFSLPAGRAAWASVAAQLVDCGHDGWMEDFGEYSPLDARCGSGATGTAAHNAYPREYHGGAAQVTAALEARAGRRLARFVRSGWTASAAASPIVWGGDPTCGWGWDGLASAVIEGLSLGASGVAMWGSDTGGFMSSLEQLTPELLRRWIQFSACCPVMRTKSSGIEVPPYRRPQIWDDDVVGTWARWAAFHTQLNDYLLAAHAEYRATGTPIMRAPALVWPEEPDALQLEDQYLLGPDLLVAPVLEPGATTRRLWVPPGDWVELWRAARYDPESRNLELVGVGGRGAVRHGPTWCDVAAPPDEIPLFVRAGAVLSLLPGDVDTLSDHGQGTRPVVGAAERDGERRVLCWPGPRVDAAVGHGHHAVSEAVAGGWRLELHPDRPMRYQVAADLRLLAPDDWSPTTVSLGGRALAFGTWSWDPAGVLDVQLGGATSPVVLEAVGSRV